MIFHAKLFVVLYALSVVDAHKAIKARSSVSNFTLYAYGTNITGLPIFFADSMNLTLIFSS